MIYGILFHLVTVYVVADSYEEALAKIRADGSVARTDYPSVDFNREPDEHESHEEMITHFGWD